MSATKKWLDLSRHGLRLQMWETKTGSFLPVVYGPAISLPENRRALAELHGSLLPNNNCFVFDQIPTKEEWATWYPNAPIVEMPLTECVRLRGELLRPAAQVLKPHLATLRDAFRVRLRETPTVVWDSKHVDNFIREQIKADPILFDSDDKGLKEQLGYSEREIQETLESAVVDRAREITTEKRDPKEIYQALIDLYRQQPVMKHRTSGSVENQQYSTPVPIAYLAQWMAGVNADTRVWEPTVGNGSLVTLATPDKVGGMEIDAARLGQAQIRYPKLYQADATREPMPQGEYDVMVCNPPFGGLTREYEYKNGKIKLSRIDRLIALRALEAITDAGTAVLILGVDNYLAKPGEISKPLGYFLNYLHDHYNVVDHFEVDGKLYARQGASFPIRVIAISGRGKSTNEPSKQVERIEDWNKLFERAAAVRASVSNLREVTPSQPGVITDSIRKTPEMDEETGQVVYEPASAGRRLGTMVPQNLAAPTLEALEHLTNRRGNVNEFVATELGWTSEEVQQALAAEQIDAVALAIDNATQGKGFILGDQTGIGKGRVMATLMRWAVLHGQKPIFITEKANLFKDILRDLDDIGSREVVEPLVVNDGEAIKDEDGNIIVKSSPRNDLLRVMDENEWGNYNAVFMTYSQVNRAKSKKSEWLSHIAKGNLLLLDESHNAGGASNTGDNVLSAVRAASSVGYSSATFAKVPANMGIYERTDMFAGVAPDELIESLIAGGKPVQEVLSSLLAKSGQYIRREHRFKADLAFKIIRSTSERDRTIADQMSAIYRNLAALSGDVENIIGEENRRIKDMIEKLPKEEREMAKRMGVNYTHFVSRMWNLNSQFLFSLKADLVADDAIAASRRGEKPVIVCDNTMESFLRGTFDEAVDTETENYDPLANVAADISFRDLMKKSMRGLISVRRTDRYGHTTVSNLFEIDAQRRMKPRDQHPLAQLYFLTEELIDELPDTLPASPIDWIMHRMEQAGFSIGEITNRELVLKYGTPSGTVYAKRLPQERKQGRALTIDRFNNGKLDAILLNRSGSTGISLHAYEKFQDQRKRHMIILQPALDINQFMQTLGRVYRTGSVVDPQYTIPVADLPLEKRPAAVLRGKLASLSANTKSDQDAGLDIQGVDMLNPIGDRVALNYLETDPALAARLYIDIEDEHEKLKGVEDNPEGIGSGLMQKLTGRIGLLPIADQEKLYADIEAAFADRVVELEAKGISIFKTQVYDLRAQERERVVLEAPKGEGAFQSAIYAVKLSYPVQVRPVQFTELAEVIQNATSFLEKDKHLSDSPILDMASRIKQFYQLRMLDAAKSSKRWAGNKDAINEALKDEQPNIIKSLNAHAEAMQRFGALLQIGGLLDNVPYKDSLIQAVVARIKIPENVAMPGQWEITMCSPDSAVSFFQVTLATLINGEDLSQPIARAAGTSTSVLRETALRRMFTDDRPSGVEWRDRWVLDGNLLSAVGLAVRMGHGKPAIYTDENGLRRRGVFMPSGMTLDRLLAAPVTLDSGAMVVDFLDHLTEIKQPRPHITTPLGEEYGPSIFALSGNRYEIRVPGTKSVGGRFFLDRALIDVVGEFSGDRDLMRVTVHDRKTLGRAVDVIGQRFGIRFSTEGKHREWANTYFEARHAKPKRKKRGLSQEKPRASADEPFSAMAIPGAEP